MGQEYRLLWRIQSLSAMSGREFVVVLIEGACRHLIGDRLDITGSRWAMEL